MKVIIIDTKEERADKRSANLFERYFKEETGLGVKYSQLKRNSYGKPEAIDGHYFNISHSKNYWCLAIHDTEVGVDIEKRRSIKWQMERRILAPNEESYRGSLLDTWVLKEAYMKMRGIGLSLDARKILVNDILKECVVEDYSNDEYICYAVCEKPSGF